MATVFTGFQQDGDRVTASVENEAGEKEEIIGRYIVSGEGARSIIRKDLDVEFEGFTYPDRTLTIEIAYDFSRHGYTHRNYISDPVEWSNLFHWIGPPERWRVHFPTQARRRRGAADASRSDAGAAPGLPEHRQAVRHRRLQFLHRASARGESVPQGPRPPRRRLRACEQPDRRHGPEQRRARRVQPRRQIRPHLGAASDADALLDLYERQRRHIAVHSTQAQTIRNKKLLAERDPAVRRRNHDELKRQSEDPKLAREFLLRTSLIASVREAAAIT